MWKYLTKATVKCKCMQKRHKMRWSQLRLMSVSWIHIGIWWQMLGETLDWEVIVVRLGPLFGEWNAFPLDKGINALTFTHSTTIYTWKMLNRWLAYIVQNATGNLFPFQGPYWFPISVSLTVQMILAGSSSCSVQLHVQSCSPHPEGLEPFGKYYSCDGDFLLP